MGHVHSNPAPVLTRVHPAHLPIHRSWVHWLTLIPVFDHFLDCCFRATRADHPYKVQHTLHARVSTKLIDVLYMREHQHIWSCKTYQSYGFCLFLDFITSHHWGTLVSWSAWFSWDITTVILIASPYSEANSQRVVNQHLINISDTT